MHAARASVGGSVASGFQALATLTNCGQACVEGTVLVAAAKEVLAVAVLIFLTARGVRLRVPGAARLVERSDLRGWREQVQELGRAARLSSLEDDLGRHCLVDVAKVEDLMRAQAVTWSARERKLAWCADAMALAPTPQRQAEAG